MCTEKTNVEINYQYNPTIKILKYSNYYILNKQCDIQLLLKEKNNLIYLNKR